MVTFEGEWQRCRPWIEATTARNDNPASLEEIRERIDARLAQFWPFERCVVITEIIPPSLHIWLAGGDMQDILANARTIEVWAKAAGCQFVDIASRKGWNRALRRIGYRPHGTGVRKVL